MLLPRTRPRRPARPAGPARASRRSVGAVARSPALTAEVVHAPPGRGQSGQAAVETVAVLPVVVLVAALLWQAALAGQAAWLAGSAARAAARAAAIEADPAAAARDVLPERLERGLEVRESEDGVRVRIRVPVLAGRSSLGRVSSTAHLREQR